AGRQPGCLPGYAGFEHSIENWSASQLSSSWRRGRSRFSTKNDDPSPRFSRASAMSALPERGQLARLRVEQGTLAVQEGLDAHQIEIGAVEGQLSFASQGQHTLPKNDGLVGPHDPTTVGGVMQEPICGCSLGRLITIDTACRIPDDSSGASVDV